MNYIASFIYHLYKDEKKAFYFMLALFSNTEFTQLFLNDLSRLKQLFYIFDRILTLFLPELNNYLKVSSISCSYFLSPWFITLFSNSYQFKNNVIPVIIIKIWDDFLLSGWEALIRAGVILLKSSYDELLNLQYEEMLHFLINDILKKFYYDNGNFQRFFKLNEETVFPIGLLSNIENEYVQEKKVREIDEENGCGKNY